jgi:hypothetical protein
MEKISKRLFSWASILEEGTRNQAVTASGMPFIYPHLALMPDAHLGKGATVGSRVDGQPVVRGEGQRQRRGPELRTSRRGP